MRFGMLSVFLCAVLSFFQPSQGADLRLNWQPGDRWVVETTPRMSASSSHSSGTKLRWSFEVTGTETVLERECWHASIRCPDAGIRGPKVEIWVDRQNGMLLRASSRLDYGTHKAELTETYVTPDGKAVPVLGMIPALPLDMPILDGVSGRTKSLEPQIYQTLTGSGRTKDLGDPGFANMVSQSIQPARNSVFKSLNSSQTSENVRVEIHTANRTIQQIWTPGKPWPIYSSNGVTESRLVEYVPAERSQEAENE